MNRLIAHLIMTPVKAIVLALFPVALLAITVEAAIKRCRRHTPIIEGTTK